MTLEWFSIECLHAKSVLKPRPRRKSRNRRQARENESDQVVFHLIGWVGGASFLNQAQSVVKQNQT